MWELPLRMREYESKFSQESKELIVWLKSYEWRDKSQTWLREGHKTARIW